jgi:hypothetical protein
MHVIGSWCPHKPKKHAVCSCCCYALDVQIPSHVRRCAASVALNCCVVMCSVAWCCRVIINTNHKKFEGTLVGKEGTVLSITSNGWVKLQV